MSAIGCRSTRVRIDRTMDGWLSSWGLSILLVRLSSINMAISFGVAISCRVPAVTIASKYFSVAAVACAGLSVRPKTS